MATLDTEILERYDREVAERFVKAPDGFLTGLRKYLGVNIVDVGRVDLL